MFKFARESIRLVRHWRGSIFIFSKLNSKTYSRFAFMFLQTILLPARTRTKKSRFVRFSYVTDVCVKIIKKIVFSVKFGENVFVEFIRIYFDASLNSFRILWLIHTIDNNFIIIPGIEKNRGNLMSNNWYSVFIHNVIYIWNSLLSKLSINLFLNCTISNFI